MDFDLSPAVEAGRLAADALGRSLPADAPARAVVAGLASRGLLDAAPDLLPSVVAVEALAVQSAAAAIVFAVHATVLDALGDDPRWAEPLRRGEVTGGMELSSEAMPVVTGDTLTGRVMWVAPVAPGGVVLVAARMPEPWSSPEEGMPAAYALALDAPGVRLEAERASGLSGLACASLALDAVAGRPAGGPPPIMAGVRLRMAAVGLGLGARALAEALAAVRADGGHDPEAQTVQGLLADAATELDAARLLTRAAASRAGAPSLAHASAAKLAATAAAFGAVERASQVVGIDSFRQGHILERLARDVRALELFAGRTEALRAAVAADIFPPGRDLDLSTLHAGQAPTA